MARILIVDDEVDLAETYRIFLEGLGHDCVVASNPMDVVPTALREQPDAVILDLNMPGVSGFDLASELRSALGSRDMALLLITGETIDDALRSRATDIGVDFCLTKPVFLDFLAEKIELLVSAPRHEVRDSSEVGNSSHNSEEEPFLLE